jgi:hypothetical protein
MDIQSENQPARAGLPAQRIDAAGRARVDLRGIYI